MFPALDAPSRRRVAKRFDLHAYVSTSWAAVPKLEWIMRRSRDRVVDKKRRSGNKSRSRAPEPARRHARDVLAGGGTAESRPRHHPGGDVKKLLEGIGTPPVATFQPDPFQL